jgi:hypothetical protein
VLNLTPDKHAAVVKAVMPHMKAARSFLFHGFNMVEEG